VGNLRFPQPAQYTGWSKNYSVVANATTQEKRRTMEEKWEWRVPTEVYSRVVGFLRPVQNWNVGKLQEWKERKTYKMDLASKRMDSDDVAKRSYL